MTPYELRLREAAGPAETEAGLLLAERGSLRVLESGRGVLRCLISDTEPREVQLTPQEAQCGCPVFRERSACRHTVAAVAMASREGLLDAMLQRNALALGETVLNALEAELPSGAELTVEPVLTLMPAHSGEPSAVTVGLRVGTDRRYVVRSLPAFFRAMREGSDLPFGSSFTYHAAWMRLPAGARGMVSVLRSVCETLEAAGALPGGIQAKSLPLSEASLRLFLESAGEQTLRVTVNGETHTVRGTRRGPVPMRFRVGGSLRALTVEAWLPADIQLLTADAAWIFTGGEILRTETAQRRLMQRLLTHLREGTCTFAFSAADAARAASELIPALMEAGAVEIEPKLERRLVREPLTVRVWLDREDRSIAAGVTYVYGDFEINPFEADQPSSPHMRGEALLLRDAAAEHRVLAILDEAGFCVRTGRALLSGTEAIWRFVSGGVAALQEVAEVYLSREFVRMAPRRPNLGGRIGMRGSLLVAELRVDEETTPEIIEILRAISRRKDYVRLENGAFLDLREMQAWQGVAEELTEAAERRPQESDGLIRLEPYRMASLNRLLQDEALPVQWEESIRDAVARLSGEIPGDAPLPAGLALRLYQQTGYRWLVTLDQLHMGGILADDMGLGKTVQFISLIRAVHEAGACSLVVAPTSLTYNWMAEFQRFAPEIRTMVLTGTQPQREQTLRRLLAAGETDVLIVSYPLMRRDIDLLAEIPFRVVALDEAQQIKNAGSAGAAAVRRLQAGSRFALTGTPLENHAGELWSLFDFILPGYLGPYADFMRKYQDGQNADDLRRRLRPFLLRRVKGDVLSELPEKNEHVLTARMTQEQEQIYRAARLLLNDRVDNVLREKGFGRGRIEVLAAITELREICCHPALVMDGYTGASGKLAMLSDLLPGALAAGRRVLLFSQFTSMLKLIRRHLETDGIRCLYLDGDTPAERRLDLTERFNAGEGDVFLISLKAGGTGLNLTGADLVIHYDPWWNPAAEDQATDRAHRIGQTRQVEVIRLITHDTVEEQVAELGERKRKLFDRLITPGEEMVTALTEQDIRSLFR
ncbi:MAG: DEAD/DEAH box helicase [Clostridia bacterium]|nr:DEAD/DEAH box helicase [Clostridia bacterium]